MLDRTDNLADSLGVRFVKPKGRHGSLRQDNELHSDWLTICLRSDGHV